MAWNDTGEERVRKFKVYQELEARKMDLERKYHMSNERVIQLTEELERQKARVTELAQQLQDIRPPRTHSGTQLSVHEILSQLERVIAEKTG